MSNPLLISGFIGYGDAIYMRPFIHTALHELGREVFVKTPWPSAFYDFWSHPHFHLCKRSDHRRLPVTHQRSMEHPAFRTIWEGEPRRYTPVTFRYYNAGLRTHGNIIECYRGWWSRAGLPASAVDPATMRFGGPHPEWSRQASGWGSQQTHGRPLALVKGLSLRGEWTARSRLPDHRVYQRVADMVRAAGRKTVVFGTPARGEWEEHEVVGDTRMDWPWDHPGVLQEAIRQSDTLVGWPSFLLPLAVALGHPRTIMVWGGYFPREHLLHPDFQHTLHYVEPEMVCSCFQLDHTCRKEIAIERIAETVAKALAEESTPGGGAPGVR